MITTQAFDEDDNKDESLVVTGWKTNSSGNTTRVQVVVGDGNVAVSGVDSSSTITINGKRIS